MKRIKESRSTEYFKEKLMEQKALPYSCVVYKNLDTIFFEYCNPFKQGICRKNSTFL